MSQLNNGININLDETQVAINQTHQLIDELLELYGRIATAQETYAPTWQGEAQRVFSEKFVEYKQTVQRTRDQWEELFEEAKRHCDRINRINDIARRLR